MVRGLLGFCNMSTISNDFRVSGLIPPDYHVGYSLRKINKYYKSSCMIVQRSSDNVELEIPFGDDLFIDQTVLLNHVGNNDGLVVRWFDQYGNSDHDLVTFGIAPRIVINGVVSVDPENHPAVDFRGDRALQSVGNINFIYNELSRFAVAAQIDDTSIYQNLAAVSTDQYVFMGTRDNTYATFYGNGIGWSDTSANTPVKSLLMIDRQYVLTSICDGQDRTYVDGISQDIVSDNMIQNNFQLILGSDFSGGDYWNGTVSEYIQYNRIVSPSERSDIENDMISVYQPEPIEAGLKLSYDFSDPSKTILIGGDLDSCIPIIDEIGGMDLLYSVALSEESSVTRPTVYTLQNGLQTYYFQSSSFGSDQVLCTNTRPVSLSDVYIVSGERTYIVVAYINRPAFTNRSLLSVYGDGGIGSQNELMRWFLEYNGSRMWIQLTNSLAISSNNCFVTGAWHIYTISVSSNGTVRFFRDNLAFGTGSVTLETVGTFAGDNLGILIGGSHESSGNVVGADSAVGEVLMYDLELSDVDREAKVNELGVKWGIVV